MTKLKRTPIYPVYPEQTKCIPFAGWEMPVQFSRIQEEHEAVRTRAGLFDVSHMGEIEVSGADAENFLQKVTTNDMKSLAVGQVHYNVMCTPDGGTIDDLLIYRLALDRYLLVVNAANIKKDEDWLRQHASSEVTIENRSDELALLALQGPRAMEILQPMVSFELATVKPFTFRETRLVSDLNVLLSRTGYTGEDGFELYVSATDAVILWKKLLEQGREAGLLPCGLGARDTLRFEAALPLYGQELSPSITPIEAGIGFVVKPEKGPFIGHERLREQKEQGASRKLVGLEMLERGIPRHGYVVMANGEQIGQVTSGTRSPTLGKDIALALIQSSYATTDTVLEIEIRGKRRRAKVVSIPFYRRDRGNQAK